MQLSQVGAKGLLVEEWKVFWGGQGLLTGEEVSDEYTDATDTESEGLLLPWEPA